MNRITHFELSTTDPAKEISFFRDVFGWEIQKWGDADYWLVTTGPEGEAGINGAIMPMMSAEQPRTTNTLNVDDIDDVVSRATAAGATVAMEKMEVGDMGWTQYLLSPTGILFGLFQSKPKAQM